MARYAGNGKNTGSAADEPIVGLESQGTSMLSLYEFTIGSTTDPPVDKQHVISMEWSTANQSGGTSVAGELLRTVSVTSDATYVSGSTIVTEPTYTETLMKFGINQRANFRWVAAPGGEILIMPDATGFTALRHHTDSPGACIWQATIMWEE